MSDARSGDLSVGFWAYPFLASNQIWRIVLPNFTTETKPSPPDLAFDVSDPTKCRIAADTDSYLTFDQTVPSTATMIYMLDSLGNFYGGGFQVINWDTGAHSYITLADTIKIRTDDATYYIPGATAVDLEMLPTIVALNGGDPGPDKNWCAVLFDDHAGHFIVRVYRIDWPGNPALTIVDTTDPMVGTPLSLDVDPVNFRIHVLAKVGGTIKATVFRYIP